MALLGARPVPSIEQNRISAQGHERGAPTISFDLCRVRASGSGALHEEDEAQAGVADAGGRMFIDWTRDGISLEDKESDVIDYP